MGRVGAEGRRGGDMKRQGEELFAELGMEVSTAIYVFLRQALRQRSIPFEITTENPNKETREAIAEVRRMKKDPAIGKAYDDVDDMFEELLS